MTYKTLYRFQRFGVPNKFVGVHLYVAYAICRTLPTSTSFPVALFCFSSEEDKQIPLLRLIIENKYCYLSGSSYVYRTPNGIAKILTTTSCFVFFIFFLSQQSGFSIDQMKSVGLRGLKLCRSTCL